MTKRLAWTIAASPLALAAAGCTAAPFAARPLVALAADSGARQASSDHDRAQAALAAGQPEQALAAAERAVAASPRDAGYRMLLADLYLKNGRFRSAADAFGDVLALQPGNPRARFSLVLARIALGENHLALADLSRLEGISATADLGLAYALAGEPARAVALLEAGARADEADSRLRQNLALAYALSGEWQKARVTAAQDLSPAELPARMEQWAAFAQPRANHDQVASMLGVTPAADAGQPSHLALGIPADVPIRIAEDDAPTFAKAMPSPPVEEDFAFAAAAPAPVVAPTYRPEPAPRIRHAAPIAEPAASGRFVVQLGAFNSSAAVERGWANAQRHYGLGAYVPVSARVASGGATLHRLSASGFATQAEAAGVCRTIKTRGGACFVRARAGDAPVRFAARDSRRG